MITQNFELTQKYTTALQRVNVSLPRELVQELLDLLGELKDTGKVRRTEDGQQFSVYDFIANVVKKGSEREVWKRLLEEHPNTVTFCDSVKLPRSDNKQANIETPVTSEFGLLVIAYILPGELGDRLRKASANLVFEAVASVRGNLQSLFDQPQIDHQTVSQLQTELKEVKADRDDSDEMFVKMRDSSDYYREKFEETEVKLHNAEIKIKQLNNKLYSPPSYSLSFSHSINDLKRDSGMACRAQVVDALIKNSNFVLGTDYTKWTKPGGSDYYMTFAVYIILLVSFRSRRGADITNLPPILTISTSELFRLLRPKVINRRLPQRER